MKLPTWQDFSSYLFTVKKLDESNTSSLKGRYSAITSYFTHCEYNKQNVYSFFHYLKNGKQLKAGTLNNYIKLLHHLNDFLEIYPDWLDGFSYYKEPRKHIDVLSQEEIDRLISAAYSYSYRRGVIVETLSQTGLRNGELCMLTWNDIQDSKLILRDTKSGELQYVPLLPTLEGKIKALKRYPHNYIFSGGRGRMYGHNLNIALREIAERAGIDRHISAHLFRHSVATLASKRNRSIAKVKEFMRHRHVETTMQYIHMNQDDIKEVAQTVSPQSMTFEVLKQMFEDFYKTVSIYPFPIKYKNEVGSISITVGE